MTNQSPGGDSDIEKKLTHIDNWLTNIVHADNAKVVPPFSHSSPQNHPNPHHKSRRNRHKPNRSKDHSLQPKPGYCATPQHPGKILNHKGLRIIPIGGFEEVGKNMMVFEFERDIIIVDMGFQFPTEDMLGIDYVLPDISYLQDKKDRIRGVFLTHGHLDHIGGIPYLLPKLGFPPVYGAPLTIGFVEKQIVEFKLQKESKLIKFDPKEKIRAGVFDVSFFRVNHSIPDAVAIVIDTPVGRVVHTGDFKFDFTPADQRPADFQEIARVGSKGVLALISDSTNAVEPGHTVTEKVIADNLDDAIRNTKGRLIVTSFSSLIGRLQQVFDSAVRHKRKVFLTGRSMDVNIRIAQNLHYIKVPRGLICDIRKLKDYKDEEVVILTTGSQGEDISGLARMAMGTHMKVKIHKGDTVIFSSNPIIGNAPAVMKVINGLARLGAHVVTNRDINIHTSGHGKQEDLKLMLKLIKPKYLIPEHGDYYMRLAHKEVAMSIGLAEDSVLLLDNGEVAVLDAKGVLKTTGEKVPADYIMVEGNERSMVSSHVLMDRQLMAENGVVVVVLKVDWKGRKLLRKPRALARGFIYLESSQDVLDKAVIAAEEAFKSFNQNQKMETEPLREHIQIHVDRTLTRLVDKRPLIVPIFE